jgi:hypothetical protein
MDLFNSMLASGDFPLGEDSIFWVIGGTIAVVAILSGSACSMYKTRMREKTRSEIAAYIAEGSMTPGDGERLMKAGEDDE